MVHIFYTLEFSVPQRLRYYECCNKTWGRCVIKSQRFEMGMDNWGEKRLVKSKVLTGTLVRTMKKTCWSCLGGRDSQESNPRETNCDSNSASAQSKESTSKSKTETASKRQIQKPNSQQNNSKSQAKTLTHCYAYSSFLWGLEMTKKRGKVALSLLI